jgi:molybdopterin-guanine dinucleotide biosynthesis protein A
VRIVGPRDKYGTAAIEDRYADRGPLGGIHAALSETQTELNLILSVDTPFVTTNFLKFLVGEGQRTDAIVTVPYVDDRFQPLCAVYRREFLSLADAALREGKNKIDALFSPAAVHRIDDAQMKLLAFDTRMFDNLNTPGEFARAQNRR